MTQATGFQTAHPSVRDYAARHRLQPDSFCADGTLALTIDGQYRVHLRPGSAGRLVMTALLLDLEALPPESCEDMLAQIARYAAGLVREHPSTLAVHPQDRWLVLQQVLPKSIDGDALEDELADFVNALSFWKRIAETVSGARGMNAV